MSGTGKSSANAGVRPEWTSARRIVIKIGVKEALFAITKEIVRADAAEADPDADKAWTP